MGQILYLFVFFPPIGCNPIITALCLYYILLLHNYLLYIVKMYICILKYPLDSGRGYLETTSSVAQFRHEYTGY